MMEPSGSAKPCIYTAQKGRPKYPIVELTELPAERDERTKQNKEKKMV